MRHQRDAFNRLIVDPDELQQRDRVDVVRGLAGQLQAGDRIEARWLGRKLADWLQAGGDLADVLGLRPPKGSKTTAQRLIRAEQRDRLLLRLSLACGGDRAALRVLAGQDLCPAAAAGILAELQCLGLPKSTAAFHRARASVSRVR